VRLFLALATALVLSASHALAGGEPRKIGESITPAGAQVSSVQSLDPRGRFVLVWQESTHPDPPEGVVAQRFSWSGPLGDPVPIADSVFVNPGDSAPSGRFLVVWREPDPPWLKHAQLFEHDVTPVGEPFAFPTAPGFASSLSVADDGQFVLAWKDRSDYPHRIWRQRFDSSAAPLEAPVAVSEIGYHPYSQGKTDVDHDASGEFVIAWDDIDGGGYGGCYNFVAAVERQRFDADGFPIGSRYVSPWMDYTPVPYPSVAVAPNGHSSTTFSPYGYCFGGDDHFARAVRNAPEQGTSLAITINNGLETVAVSDINRHAEFVVAWGLADSLFPSSWFGEVRAQLFDPVGLAVGPELELVAGVWLIPFPDVQLNDNGQFLVTWRADWPQLAHQRFCFDPALALLTAGSGFRRLQVVEVPEGTTSSGFRLPADRSTLPGVQTVVTPHGRQALVATTGPESTVLSLFDIANGVRRYEVDLGAGRSLVPGGSPVLADDEGELALVATQHDAIGEPALHFVDLLNGSVLHYYPATFAETLVAEVPPVVVSGGTAAVLSSNALDGTAAYLHRIQLLGGDATTSVTLGPGETLARGVGPVVTSDGAAVVVGTNPTVGGSPVVRVLDAADLSVDGEFALDPGSAFQRGVPPVLSENGTRAAVATHGSVPRVRVFDLSGPSIDAVIDLDADDVLLDDAGFILGPDGNTATLATWSPQGVWLRTFDLAAGSLVQELLLPGRSLVVGVGPTISPSGRHAYLLTAGDPPRIDRIDLATGAADSPLLLAETEAVVPGVDLRLTSDESVLIAATKNVTNSGTVLRLLDPETLALLHRLDFGPGEQPVAGTRVVETRCGFTLLLSTRGSQGQKDTVRMIDVGTGQVTRALEFSGPGSLVRGVGPVLPASSVAGDCNANLRLDAEDIAGGDSADCDLDGIPDECQADCNDNGVADPCDVASGGAGDLDANGVPDECQPDCNENDVLDWWEIFVGAAEDCNGDHVPDECDADCNSNTVPDVCDIFEGTSPDCNGDGVPDECQPGLDSDLDGHPECSDNCPLLANATQSDHDLDGVGDACDPDDDNDGVSDLVDNCRFVSNRDQRNTDADLEGDACDDDDDGDTVLDVLDNCVVVWNPDQANGDGDARGDPCDCATGDDTVWTAPGEARNVTWQSSGSMTWEAPGETGGDEVFYDLLKAETATGFGTASCILSGVQDLIGIDNPAPPPEEVRHYLVRARNACPGGETLGAYSDGTPRTGSDCP